IHADSFAMRTFPSRAHAAPAAGDGYPQRDAGFVLGWRPLPFARRSADACGGDDRGWRGYHRHRWRVEPAWVAAAVAAGRARSGDAAGVRPARSRRAAVD